MTNVPLGVGHVDNGGAVYVWEQGANLKSLPLSLSFTVNPKQF